MNVSLLLTLVVLAPPPPSLVRVAVVDNSGSMAGERVATVRDELRKIVRQLPPSPEHPLLLIRFGSSVAPTQVVTDPQAAEAAIASIDAGGGGTRIAPALTQAVTELKAFAKTQNVLVLLYTDGEDGDRAGIRTAEEELDKLFASRSQEGLSQTVFLKRWGGANIELVERMKQRGRANVVDAGELEITPLTLDPAVKVIAVRRDPQTPTHLVVEYEGSVSVRGTSKAFAAIRLRLRCIDAGVSGDLEAVLETGKSAPRGKLSLPVSAAAEKARKTQLHFEFTPLTGIASGTTLVLPQLPTSLVTVPIDIPPLAVAYHLAATLEKVVAEGWADPHRLHVQCRGEVVIQVTPVTPATVEGRMQLRLQSPLPLDLPATQLEIEIERPETRRVPIRFTAPLANLTAGGSASTVPLEMEIVVVAPAPNVTCVPQRCHVLHSGLPAPSKLVTTIKPLVRRTGTPVWVDLVDALAEFEAEVAITVAGSIPERTSFTLLSPASVRNQVLPAGTTLQAGENLVRLKICAEVSPGKQERLTFTILPPPATPAIAYRVESDFCVAVRAPPALALAHGPVHRPERRIATSISDLQDRIGVVLTPILLGIHPQTVRRVPQVLIVAKPPAPPTTWTGKPFSAIPVQFTLPPPTSPPFFHDVLQTIDVELRPAQPTPAITNGQVRILVRRQAPFKRLLIYLAWALFPLGTMFVLFRILRKLREPARNL